MLAMMTLIPTARLAAQEACAGPGAAFGVVSYQCGDCTMQQKSGDPTGAVWQFRAEPLVLKTAGGSVLESGDIVEAVNGKPITTQAGTQLFTHTAPGEFELTVRRRGRQLTLHARAAACASPGDRSAAGQSASDVGGTAATAAPHGRFGFAIACTDCSRQVRDDGSVLWTFPSNPVIGDIDPDGPAARAGLRGGDVVIAVNGRSVLEEAGARALGEADRAATIRVTVERQNHQRTTVELKARGQKPNDEHSPAAAAWTFPVLEMIPSAGVEQVAGVRAPYSLRRAGTSLAASTRCTSAGTARCSRTRWWG